MDRACSEDNTPPFSLYRELAYKIKVEGKNHPLCESKCPLIMLHLMVVLEYVELNNR